MKHVKYILIYGKLYVEKIVVSFNDESNIYYTVYETSCCNNCPLLKEIQSFKSSLKNIEYNKTCRNCLDKSRKSSPVSVNCNAVYVKPFYTYF